METDAKEEVRARLAIEDVVGEYVSLKRAGRNWKGLSPFSGEKTPSFFVSPDKGIWHDFSSNQGGDIFSFVMRVEGVDFRTALEMLARKAGVELSVYESGNSKHISEKKQRLRAINESVCVFYQRFLYKDRAGVEYVKKRCLDRASVVDFRIGFAPDDGRAAITFLEKKGYTREDITAAGLVGSRGGDIFRSRMMIPLSDGQGQIIGFTGRIAADIKNAPKYLNTPQTLLYDKSRHIFGLFQAKEAIRANGFVVVVEGNLDVVSSYQAGVKQTVATAGTAMTEEHLKALARLTPDIRLAYDGDKAGLAASERAIAIADKLGIELSIISMPDDVKDPDELIQKDPQLWKAAIEHTRPAIEWVIDQYEKRYDLSSASGKRALTTDALRLLKSIDNPVVQEHYFQIISGKTGVSLDTLTLRYAQLDDEKEVARLKPVKAEQSEKPDQQAVLEDFLLALMTMEPGAIDVAVKEMSAEEFTGEDRQTLFDYFTQHPGESIRSDIPDILKNIETYVKIIMLKAEMRYQNLPGEERLVEAVSLVRTIKAQQRKSKITDLNAQLREAEQGGDNDATIRLRTMLSNLIKEDKR